MRKSSDVARGRLGTNQMDAVSVFIRISDSLFVDVCVCVQPIYKVILSF